MHIQNDQYVMGIILRYVCWGTHRPPPGGPTADRPTRRPPRFGSTKGGGRGPLPPPLQPPKLSHTPRVHTLAGGGPRALCRVIFGPYLPSGTGGVALVPLPVALCSAHGQGHRGAVRQRRSRAEASMMVCHTPLPHTRRPGPQLFASFPGDNAVAWAMGIRGLMG